MITTIDSYHGTTARFSAFHIPPSGVHFGTFDQAAHAATLQLARMPLGDFEKCCQDEHGFRGIILLVTLTFKNLKWVADQKTPEAWSTLIAESTAHGFDALAYENDFEGRTPATSFALWNQSQMTIKEPKATNSLSASHPLPA